MAHSLSAKKRIRTNERYRVVNQARMSRIRTFIKKVEHAIAGGNQVVALEAFKVAQPEIHRGVHKGVLHRNTAARKLSRLMGHIKALNA
jgi:small subunit ribosomal protein S20